MYISAHALPALSGGEMSGAMLKGLVQALKNVHIVTGDEAASLVEDVESEGWYPMSIFFALLNELYSYQKIDLGPILFRAGEAFVEDWFANCGANHLFSSVHDFVSLQSESGGYRLVHRGDPQQIGWQELAGFDLAGGQTVVVCVTPYPLEFERGLFYRGMLMADDLDYVSVESVEEPYNRYLRRKTHTIRFCPKPDRDSSAALDVILAGMSPGNSVPIPGELVASLAWRLKTAEERRLHDRRYHEQSSLLLTQAARDVLELSRWALRQIPDAPGDPQPG